MKVLIADDDLVFLELTARRLRSVGVESLTALDASQAVAVAEEALPDLIVLDVRMHGSNGLDALRQLKASARCAGIPVIVASALDESELPARVLALGAAAFVRKPVRAADLVARMAEILGTPLGSRQPAGVSRG